MVEIKITGNTPLEALSHLTAFGMHCMQNSEVSKAACRILEAEKNEERKKAATAATAAPPADPSGPAAGETGPTAAPSEKAAAPKVEEPPAPSGDAKVPTQEEVTSKGREAAKKYGSAAIKPILQEFGVARMSELAEKDRAAFLARLESLGDGNA